VAVVLVPVAALLRVPYDRARAAHGERSTQEVVEGSATPRDYLKTTRRLSTYSWNTRAFNRQERELYPGTSTLALAAIGLVAAPVRVGIPLIAAAAAAFDWSLGLNGLTYRALRALVPPFRSVRVPARFAVLVGVALILLAGFGARRLIARGSPRRQLVTTVCLAAAVLLDLRMRSEMVDYYPAIPSFYDRLPPDAVLAELPVGHEVDYMYFSTRQWGALLSGYSGFIPRDEELAGYFASFPSRESIEGLRSRGATHLTYNCAFERSEQRCRANLEALAGNAGLELIAAETWQGRRAQVYRVK
jgi:hypothetical protein